MDAINLAGILEIAKVFGVPGLVITFWWLDTKKVWKILDQYKADMEEQRRMYASNVKLVQGYEKVADDLKDVVIMNTQVMTSLVKSIETNQYCPHVRLQKKATGKED